ncbi:LysE family translocator [Maricaulis salignorans]|uniref:Threonine/homoserine/homoserine lactone efflux protein n=1 Tax=Maricaulis salignorans TaxID=144026 RepID=A0A1G9R723_9PROT|nr:LysE family translocator [Maricaulis salignorans]SDM19023.1 Threonine/homoserine/homoserine lactone efflux protein [Maricaulis salignorans]
MFDLAALATFAFTVLVIELTPGPNMAWLAVLSVSEGRRAGFAAVAGVALGLATIGGAAALGLGAVIERFDWLYQSLRWAGVAFLLYLAWEGWRDANGAPEVLARQGYRRYFARGFLINALNPKAALFYIAVFPQFIHPNAPVAAQAALLATISVSIATAIHLGIVLLAGSARSFLEDPARHRVFQRALSLLLVGVAVWLLMATAR